MGTNLAASSTDAPEAATGRPARPWLAALLSLLQPGLGHLYAWRPGLGFALWAATFGTAVVGLWALLRLRGVVVPALLLAGAPALYLAAVWHAWRTARRAPAAHRPRRWALALALAAFYVVLSLPGEALKAWVRRAGVEAFKVPTASMEPTVLMGDFVLVVPRPGAALGRDELATYRWEGHTYLKRVAGLPGDTLEMHAGRLVRNGRAVAEPYARVQGEDRTASGDFAWQRAALAPGRDMLTYRPTLDTWGPLGVPPGQVFILGDNRHQSLDSRFVGFIAVDSVLGRPIKIYFSRDSLGTVRWDRVGRQLK